MNNQTCVDSTIDEFKVTSTFDRAIEKKKIVSIQNKLIVFTMCWCKLNSDIIVEYISNESKQKKGLFQ